MDDFKKIAIILGGTATALNIIAEISIFLLFHSFVEVIDSISDINLVSSNVLFIDFALILWAILEATTCWIVVKLSKNKKLKVVTISSCCLNLSVFWSMKICHYFTDDFWEEFVFYYYAYILLFVLGIFVVHKIMISEEHKRFNKET